MSSENLKVKLGIAYASFLHDVGKIGQRAKVERRYVTTEIEKDLIQPGYGYVHVLYTQEFLEQKIKEGFSFGDFFLPLGKPLAGGEPTDTVPNLAAKHHKPETAFQWLIAEADRLSAGHDRKERDEDDELEKFEHENKKQWYLRERSLPPFYVIDLQQAQNTQGQAQEKPKTYYEIRSFQGNSKEFRFPKKKENLSPNYGEELSADYKRLYDEFCEQFKQLFESSNKVEELSTFEKFLTLCERFYYTVPSSTIDMPDINLYDHSYLIAAIAVALYDFHKENGTFTSEGVRDRNLPAFRVIQGDLSGIQSYILNFKHEGQTALAKTLRARSFYLQVIAKDVERKILKELELPPTSVIVSAGSKFQILAPNVKRIDKVIQELQKQIDEWFLERYMGEISFLLSASEPFSPNALMKQDSSAKSSFVDVMQKATQKLEEKKFKKLESILKTNGAWNPQNFVFSNQYEKYLQNGACALQGKFPAESNTDDGKGNKVSLVAFEEKKVGTLLAHEKALSFVSEGGTTLPFSKLKLDEEGDYHLLQDSKSLKPSLSFLARLPEFQKGISKEDYEENYCKTCNAYDEGKCEILKEFKYKSFHCLAQESLNPNDKSGVSLLAVFKADVDNLGKIFQSGIPKDKISISRYSAISRSLNYFFTEYLHEVLLQEKYQSIYTVYAGGDDLFLLGAFPQVLEFAKEFRKTFSEYTGDHPDLSFSAGIAFMKPRTPISIGASLAEEELSNAKKHPSKNSIGIFGERLTWKEFEQALQISNQLIEFYKDEDEILSMGMLYRLLRYVRMYKARGKDIKNLMYASYFAYDKARNIYEKMTEKADTLKDEKLKKLAQSLETWFTSEHDQSKRKILEFLDVAIQLTMYQVRGGKESEYKMVG
ncbi:MAG: type III-A CRISPR-associated protein Cas10/Csm1 [Leptospiraceae bacterium]|nr:type III-A CRISPR-associated protein Cas10/Csm1 [Leptospiraceae bacterium]